MQRELRKKKIENKNSFIEYQLRKNKNKNKQKNEKNK